MLIGDGKCCIIIYCIDVYFESYKSYSWILYDQFFFGILLSNNNFKSERGQWGQKTLKVFKLLAEISATNLRATKS